MELSLLNRTVMQGAAPANAVLDGEKPTSQTRKSASPLLGGDYFARVVSNTGERIGVADLSEVERAFVDVQKQIRSLSAA